MRAPDLMGAGVQAWKIAYTPEVIESYKRERGYEPGGLASWVVTGPFHPAWSWWFISVAHLREIEGAPPPHKQYPGAEYEIMCLSLDPDPKPPRGPVDVDKIEAGDVEGGMPGFLSPADWVVQFDGVTDEQAAEVAALAVMVITSGKASPDSDWRSWWEQAIPGTVKHLLGEPH